MAKVVTKRAGIEANTIYADNTLVANDSTVTLPEATPLTADISAMGTASIPLMGLIDDMELTITKVGIDKNMTILTRPGSHDVEIRWVQDVVATDGTISQEGCKAFLKVIPKTIHPGASLEIGSTSENDLTFEVLRYRLVVSGEELLLIDRLSHILRVNGTDYYDAFNSYL